MRQPWSKSFAERYMNPIRWPLPLVVGVLVVCVIPLLPLGAPVSAFIPMGVVFALFLFARRIPDRH